MFCHKDGLLSDLRKQIGLQFSWSVGIQTVSWHALTLARNVKTPSARVITMQFWLKWCHEMVKILAHVTVPLHSHGADLVLADRIELWEGPHVVKALFIAVILLVLSSAMQHYTLTYLLFCTWNNTGSLHGHTQ